MSDTPLRLGQEWSKLDTPPEEISAYDQAVYEFDQARANLLEAYTQHAQANSTASRQKIDACKQAVESTLMNTINLMLATGESTDVCFAGIANLVVDEDTARVKHLRQLTNSSDFRYLKDDGTPFEEHLRQLSLTVEGADFAKEVASRFAEAFLNDDTTTFMRKIDERRASADTGGGQWELWQQLGMHTVAAARIGARLVYGASQEFRRRWLF